MFPIPISLCILKNRNVHLISKREELFKMMQSNSLPVVRMGLVIPECTHGTSSHAPSGSDCIGLGFIVFAITFVVQGSFKPSPSTTSCYIPNKIILRILNKEGGTIVITMPTKLLTPANHLIRLRSQITHYQIVYGLVTHVETMSGSVMCYIVSNGGIGHSVHDDAPMGRVTNSIARYGRTGHITRIKELQWESIPSLLLAHVIEFYTLNGLWNIWSVEHLEVTSLTIGHIAIFPRGSGGCVTPRAIHRIPIGITARIVISQPRVGIVLGGARVRMRELIRPLLTRLATLGNTNRATVVGLIEHVGTASFDGCGTLNLDVTREQGKLGAHSGCFLLG
mmetsp:Transcript_11728/g.25731  ORF Transcript_11728/g.25731 Transcript_11728/m.25731 type:complete len:337 (-) Transcript_11728:2330-3340(-)